MTAKPTEFRAIQRPTLVQTRSISVSERDSIDAKYYNGRFGESAKTRRRSRASTKKHESLECEICNITYSSQQSLQKHRQYYGNPKYPCTECGTKFTDARQLRFHITHAHGEPTVMERYKRKCPVCKQMAQTGRYLRSHLYHYHNEWAIKNYITFFSSPNIEKKETSFDISLDENEAENTPQRTPDRTSTLERKEDIALGSTSINPPESTHSSKEEGDIDTQRFLEMYENPVKLEAFSYDTKTEACDDDLEYSRQSNSEIANESYIDEILRNMHSCKECYVPLTRIKVEKTNPAYDLPVSRVQAAEETITTDNLSFSRIHTPERTAVNENFPFDEIRIPDNSMTTGNSQYLEIPEPTASENLPYVEIQIPEKPMTTENLPCVEIQIPYGGMTTENSPYSQNQIADKPTRTENSPFVEIGTPEQPTTTKSSEFPKNQVLDEPRTVEDSQFLENQAPVAASVAQDWSSLGIHVPTITSTTDIQHGGTENVESSELIDSTVRLQDNLRFELSDEMPLDQRLIGSDSNAFGDIAAKISEVPSASSSSLFETTGIEVMPNPTEAVDHDGNILIASKICDKYFTNKRAMQRHFRQRHMIAFGDAVFCVCGKSMFGRTEKEKHFYQHCGKYTLNEGVGRPSETFTPCRPLEKTRECPSCGEKFWLETCLRNHQIRCRFAKIDDGKKRLLTLKIHRQYRRQPRNTAEYVCTECNSGFNTATALSQHKQKYANTENHECPICKTIFGGRRLLKGHMQSTHEPSRKKLYSVFCEICNQGFTKNLYKRIHIMHCHAVEDADEAEIVDLEEIPKFVFRKDELASTDATVPADQKCNICNIVFVSRKRLIDHTIYYKKDEVVCCNICGKRFEGQYMAHQHNKEFHYAKDMQQSYTHYCHICHVGFMYMTHLRAHMAHVHEFAMEINNLSTTSNLIELKNNFQAGSGAQHIAKYSKYFCDICEIRFQSAAVLANHELKFSNDGEFACNQCPRKCRTASTLLDHISINHTVDVVSDGVKCSRCNENLPTRAAWVSHVKHFHNSDGSEPSEFCFENNVSSSREFGDIDVEIIPTNDSISSGMSYVNFGNATNPTDRQATGGDHSENSSHEMNQFGESSKPRSANEVVSATKIGINTCDTCALVCWGPTQLATHIALYSNNGQYLCPICGRRFAWQTCYENHKMKHFHREPTHCHFCPTCDEGFETVTAVNMHKAHFHQVLQDDEKSGRISVESSTENRVTAVKSSADAESRQEPEIIDVEESSNNGSPRCRNNDRNHLEELAECKICIAVFPNNKLLEIHKNNFHSSLSIALSSKRSKKESGPGGNRFYILAGMEILPEAVDVIEKNFERCSKGLGLMNCIYRYGFTHKCDICGTCLASKEMLKAHQGKVHRVSSIDPIENEYLEMQESPEKLTVKRTAAKRSYGKVTRRVEESLSSASDSLSERSIEKKSATAELPKKLAGETFTNNILKSNTSANPDKQAKRSYGKVTRKVEESLSSASDSLSERSIEKKSVTAELPKKLAGETFTKSMLKSNTSANPDKQVEHYRCKVCDIIFVNKSLLRVHQVNGQCLKGSIERVDRETSQSDEISMIENPESKNSNHTQELSDGNSQSDGDIECLKIIGPANGGNSRCAPTGEILPSGLRLIQLPPGNYRIGKLKVRLVGNSAAQNLVNEARTKRKDEIEKDVAPPAKRVRKVFDPVAYRELCRQHNLVPAAEGHEKKTTTVPCEIVLH